MAKLSDYDFFLPQELIAQNPTPKRGDSRLLVMERATKKIYHRKFPEIVEYFDKNDCLVINVTRVIPARIFGKKETGGKVELLLVSEVKENLSVNQSVSIWRVLLKPSLESGRTIVFNEGLSGRIVDKKSDGEYLVEFNKSGSSVYDYINKFGSMPLPPYIKRKDTEQARIDAERYQTVYAKESGSIAAPTAGLHFTNEILSEIKSRGVAIVELVLHVGPGTFKKIKTNDIEKHQMLSEWYYLSETSAQTINERKQKGGRVFAVGTTVVRTLETLAQDDGYVKPGSGETSLYIYPGYKFKVIDCLVTNFHLPKSTPLLLVAAFCSREFLLSAYNEAIKNRYNFFSYGDATLII